MCVLCHLVAPRATVVTGCVLEVQSVPLLDLPCSRVFHTPLSPFPSSLK